MRTIVVSPSYHPDPGWCGDPRRGASMGRASHGEPGTSRIYLRRVSLRGDYDPGGSYWGSNSRGRILFEAFDADETFYWTCRAASREDAVAQLRARFPEVILFRT